MLVGFALLAALSCCRGYEIVPAEIESRIDGEMAMV